jgi:LmbE family N-acetylglucosaminyl deacetylase
MKLVAFLLTLSLASPALTQTRAQPKTQSPEHLFTDPANLRGERVSPSNGHELPVDQGVQGLQQLLRRLNTRASILNIVAHPDDEDGGMLTLYSRGLGARVADLSLTRGEGGQNAVTGDFEDALGLLRTQELLSSDRYPGISQLFGTEVDFGFSKTKQEAFDKWGHQRVLYDAVRAIRLFRPLVITATFVGSVTDGHGQHQVSGEIAQEAFLAAADPAVFPDMIAEGILPWQALRVYARVPMGAISSKGLFDYATGQYTPARFVNYVTGQVTTTVPSTDVTVHEGTTDPLLTIAAANPADLALLSFPGKPLNPNTPLSYIQFARIGLGLQRTQITRDLRLPGPGPADVSYHLYGSCTSSQPPSTHPASTHPASAQPASSQPASRPKYCHPEQAQRAEGPATPSAAAHLPAPFSPNSQPAGDNPALANEPTFFTGIDTSITSLQYLAPGAFPTNLIYDLSRYVQASIKTFNPAHPESVAPLLAEALQDDDTIIESVEKWKGDPLQKANALHELRIKRVQLNQALALALSLSIDATSPATDLVQNSTPTIRTTLSKPASTTLTQLEITGVGPAQQVTSTEPDTTLPADHLTPITQPYFYRDNIEQAVYKLRDPALRNAPQTPWPLTAWATVTYNGATVTLGRVVHTGPQPASIIPAVSIAAAPHATVFPLGYTRADITATLHTSATTANVNVQSPPHWTITAAPASNSTIDFALHPTSTLSGPQAFTLTATAPDHHAYTEGFRAVGYPGLIATNYFTPAITRIVPVDLNLPPKSHRRIAYLPGTGDADPEALESIGITPTILTVADLTPAKLSQFDTVLLGVRTYAAHPDLHGAPTQALLDYARSGGNVVLQFQTAEFTAADAPYPLTLGRDAEKVVDETAPVVLLDPTSSLLTTPNRITAADFNGWIEERGHGFLRTWDHHYTPLTETHDPGGPETAPQLPQRGGLLTTQLGKGRWTYCAFALYRQLPEAVPGAYRIFLNLLTNNSAQ